MDARIGTLVRNGSTVFYVTLEGNYIEGDLAEVLFHLSVADRYEVRKTAAAEAERKRVALSNRPTDAELVKLLRHIYRNALSSPEKLRELVMVLGPTADALEAASAEQAAKYAPKPCKVCSQPSERGFLKCSEHLSDPNFARLLRRADRRAVR